MLACMVFTPLIFWFRYNISVFGTQTMDLSSEFKNDQCPLYHLTSELSGFANLLIAKSREFGSSLREKNSQLCS